MQHETLDVPYNEQLNICIVTKQSGCLQGKKKRKVKNKRKTAAGHAFKVTVQSKIAL